MNIEQLKMLPNEFLIELIANAKKALAYKQINERFVRRKKTLKRLNNQSAIDLIESNKEISNRNSSDFYIPFGHGKRKLTTPIKYLPCLMAQDWSSLFKSPAYSNEKKFYVYAHLNPDRQSIVTTDDGGGIYKGLPFYIGKGCGDRAFDLKRNQGHGKMLDKLVKKWKKDDIVKIIFDNLTESQAFEAESKLIYFFGTVYGAQKGFLYNLDTPKTPKFKGFMQAFKNLKNESDGE